MDDTGHSKLLVAAYGIAALACGVCAIVAASQGEGRGMR